MSGGTHEVSLEGLKIKWDTASANKWSTIAAVVGVLGIGATLGGMAVDKKMALASYLIAFELFLSLALGSTFFVLIQHLTGSRWSVTVRRFAESSMATLPVFALLFLPIAIFGMHELYHWTHAEAVAKDQILQAKSAYLNLPFFYARAVVYFVIWTGIAVTFWKKSTALAQGGEAAVRARQEAAGLAAPSMALFALSLTFASFDWLMSLDPHWFSTMFGVYFFAGSVQACFAFLVVSVIVAHKNGLLEKVVTVEHYHDLGKLLFGFSVFFAYIAFSQYFLIWYANIPEETIFFYERWGDWKPLSLSLLFLGFLLPFFTLISRQAKRTQGVLLLGAIFALTARVVDHYWLVMPKFAHHPTVPWMFVTALVGIGGIFFAGFFRMLGSQALIPVGDPYIGHAMRHENV